MHASSGYISCTSEEVECLLLLAEGAPICQISDLMGLSLDDLEFNLTALWARARIGERPVTGEPAILIELTGQR